MTEGPRLRLHYTSSFQSDQDSQWKIFPSTPHVPIIIFSHLRSHTEVKLLALSSLSLVWEPDFVSAHHNDKQEGLSSVSQSPVGSPTFVWPSHWQILFTFPGLACFWSLVEANRNSRFRVVDQSEAWERPGSGGDFSSLNVTGHPHSPGQHNQPRLRSQKLPCSVCQIFCNECHVKYKLIIVGAVRSSRNANVLCYSLISNTEARRIW